MALEAVQGVQAGHASIESTIYLHLADDWLAAQYRKPPRFSTRNSSPTTRQRRCAVSAQRPGHNGTGGLPGWAELETHVPAIVATMRRYLQQIGCVLRPRSVVNTDMALRSFAAFLVDAAPEVTSIADVTRRVEGASPAAGAATSK